MYVCMFVHTLMLELKDNGIVLVFQTNVRKKRNGLRKVSFMFKSRTSHKED